MVGFGHYQDSIKARRPEWTQYHINYANLKQLIKRLRHAAIAGRAAGNCSSTNSGNNLIGQKESSTAGASGQGGSPRKAPPPNKPPLSNQAPPPLKEEDDESDEAPIVINQESDRTVYRMLMDHTTQYTSERWYNCFKDAMDSEVAKAGQFYFRAVQELRDQSALGHASSFWDHHSSAAGLGGMRDVRGSSPGSDWERQETAVQRSQILGDDELCQALHKELIELQEFEKIQRTAIRKIVKKCNKALVKCSKLIDNEACPQFETKAQLATFDKQMASVRRESAVEGVDAKDKPETPMKDMTSEALLNELELAYAALHHGEDLLSARRSLHSDPGVEMLVLGCALGALLPCASALIYLFLYNMDAVALRHFWCVLPLYRITLLFNLWIWVWGLDLIFFRGNLLNHTYILEIEPQKQTPYVHILRVGALYSLVLIVNFCFHLNHWEADRSDKHTHTSIWIIWMTFFLLINPLPFLCHEARFAFLRICRTLILLPVTAPLAWANEKLPSTWRSPSIPPLQKVRFREFFIADQFTSAPILLGDILYAGCFTISGAWRGSDQHIMSVRLGHWHCVQFAAHWKPVMVLWPFLWRFVQCLVMLHTTGKRAHLVNAGKYFSGLVVIFVATASVWLPHSDGWWLAWVIAVSINQTYCFAWDVLMDWGCIVWIQKQYDRFGQPVSRRHLVPKWMLLTLIPINGAARYVCLTQVSEGLSPYNTDPRVLLLVLGAIEVMRRMAWNVFRIENEQLHNLEGYWSYSDEVPPVIRQIYGHQLPWHNPGIQQQDGWPQPDTSGALSGSALSAAAAMHAAAQPRFSTSSRSHSPLHGLTALSHSPVVHGRGHSPTSLVPTLRNSAAYGAAGARQTHFPRSMYPGGGSAAGAGSAHGSLHGTPQPPSLPPPADLVLGMSAAPLDGPHPDQRSGTVAVENEGTTLLERRSRRPSHGAQNPAAGYGSVAPSSAIIVERLSDPPAGAEDKKHA